MSERTYSEDEMAALLERAAELQAHSARTNERSRGLTLTELEAIAEEAGLNPEHLRQAASEMEKLGPSLLGKSVRTTKTHVHVEQWVDGELTVEAIEDIVDMLRQRFGSGLPASMGGMGEGTLEQVGRMLEWKHVSASGIETSVRMKPRDGRVHLQLGQRVGLASPVVEGLSYGGILAGFVGIISGGVLDSVLIGFLTFFVLSLIAVPAVTYADRVWRKKKHRNLEELSERVAGLIATHQDPGQVQTPVLTPVAGRVVLPADEEVDESVPVAQHARTRST